jgi:hypothetical protein
MRIGVRYLAKAEIFLFATGFTSCLDPPNFVSSGCSGSLPRHKAVGASRAEDEEMNGAVPPCLVLAFYLQRT